MLKLRHLLESTLALPAADLEMVLGRFREHTLKKDAVLIREGQIVSNYYFVENGGLRIFLKAEEREITGWIAFENDFFTELASYKQQKPSRYKIAAIEDTTVFLISKSDMEDLYESIPKWQQFVRELWEDAFLKVVDGILAYQTLSAEERYKQALEKSDLLQRLTLKEVSSFLGVTPNSLSRIRKNIK